MTTTTEYGTRSTWPLASGGTHVEHRESQTRSSAESSVRCALLAPEPTDPTVELVERTHTDTGWQTYTPQGLRGDTIGNVGPDDLVRWGARLTWADGHVEVRWHGRGFGDEPYQRRDAEYKVDTENEPVSTGAAPQVTAELVYRVHAFSAWQPVAVPALVSA